MKRTVAAGIMAVLACALFLVPYASARVTIDSDVVPSSGDFDSKFTYIANLTSPTDAPGNVRLIIGSDYDNPSINISYNLMEMESDCRYGNIINIPSGEVCTVTKEVYFTDPALMQGDFKNWTKKATPCEWDKAWHQINFTGWPFKDEKSEYVQGSPILAFREPKIKLNCPRSVAWCEDFIFTVRVEDKFGGTGDIWIYLDNRSLFDDSISVPQGGGVYPYKERPFNVSMVCNTSTVVFNYTTNGCGDKNISQEVHILPIPCPEITAYLDGDQLFETTENRENIRYVEKSNSSLPFKAKITDYVGSANVTLKLVVNNDSSEWHNHSRDRTLTGTVGEATIETYECGIPFEKEEKNFTIFLNYSNEMPIKNCVYNYTYNLIINPLDIEFKNATVDPKDGNWNDTFDYTVWVNASKDLTIALNVFDPCLETWPGAGDREYNKNGWKQLNWTIHGKTNFSENCSGESKFYLEYEGKETEVYPGPDLGGNENKIINQTPPIGHAKFYEKGVEPKIGLTGGTLFNYSVDMTAAEEGKVELFTKCPRGAKWDTQGEKEYDTKGSNKTLKWARIELPCFNCGDAEYMFRFMPGFVESKNYTGPTIIEEEFGELSVSPGKGTKYTKFNFSVNFSGCIEEELTLQVWNSNSEKWENVSTEHYIPSDIETVPFSKIRCPENLVPQWSNERVIKWRVKGIISNSSIVSTYWDIELNWYNSSFYPEEGWWNDKFNFSVNLSANLDGYVELQIKLDDSKKDSWNPIGERGAYNRSDPQIVRWPGKSICNEPYEGNVSYRFVFYWRGLPYPSSHSYPGPKLFIPINISILSNVSPNDGICYIENHVLREHFRNSDIPLFTYSINVSAAKDTSIKLVTINPLGEATEYEARRYYAPGIKTLNWTIESTNFEPMGIWNYKFMYRYDARYGWVDYREEKYKGPKIFKGPKIIAVLRDFDIDPELLRCGDSCNVTVVVNGSRDLAITLELCNLTSPCKHVQNGEKSYNSSEGEQPMVWKDIKPWELFRCKDTLLFNLNVTGMKEDV